VKEETQAHWGLFAPNKKIVSFSTAVRQIKVVLLFAMKTYREEEV
jgi:hypothetical protein